MGYCTLAEVDKILANALTSATDPQTNIRRNNLQIGNVRDKNNISNDVVNQYVRWACQEIDSHISELYKTPVCELADFEGSLYADLTVYNAYIVLNNNCPLSSGDSVIITDGFVEETHVIDEVLGDGVFSTVSLIEYPFETDDRVLRVKYPDPLPFVAARLAAANIYDKYFASQASPNTSDYGRLLREQARQKINDIRGGGTIIHGVKRIGRRFYDPTLVDQYDLPKGSDADKGIDQIGN